MDAIDSAVERGLHITDDEKLKSQSWGEFESACSERRLFIYGIGVITKYFWEKCKPEVIHLEGIIDSSPKKQGRSLSEYLGDAYTKNSDYIVLSPDVLKEYPADDIVVLIASSKYYEDISHDLKELGISHYYSLLNMEYNERKILNTGSNNIYENEHEQIAQCVKSCIENYVVNSGKIVFCGFGTYSDHGKYITEQLIKRAENLDIVWVVTDLSAGVPKGVRLINSVDTEKYIYEMETAKVWIVSTMVPEYIIKREGQIYIHTKHWASITLKKFFLDASSVSKIEGNRKWWLKNAEMMDYIIVGSEFDAKSCRRGLSSTAEMLHFGSPRSDALYAAVDYRKKICDGYHIEMDKGLMLYAPTYRFRKNGAREIHVMGEIDLDFQRLRKALKAYSGKEWYILLRLHPGVAIESKKVGRQDGVIDVSDYEDSQELVAASDALISDFSSIMFEPAFVGKPVFLYAPDKESYMKEDYELLLDYDSLPFPIAQTNEELEKEIVEFDEGAYTKRVEEFLRSYGVCEDGRASARAAEFITNNLLA
ncbi:MAG: hypothetical protein HFH15_10370 [Ruminococcus sp.]|nr:hypothetical protein [Ruminococcus sp.]